MKFSKFKQDINKAEQGSWVDIGDGAKVKIARIGNKNYQDRVMELLKPYKQSIRNKTVSDRVIEDVINIALAETVLVGWEGFKDDNGEEVPYNKGNALKYLQDPAYADFRTLINDLANEIEVFRQEDMADTASKSG